MTDSTSHHHPDHHRKRKSFFHRHSLSFATIGVLLVWFIGYLYTDPQTHIGAFFGNAIADWSGVVVTLLGTKFLVERGSRESFKPSPERPDITPLHRFVHEHSLGIFLVVTGVFWIIAFIRMDANSRWGQVVGNIVSEWTQIAGMVFLTKRLIEVHSKAD